jgi:hypothetical protein
MPVDSINRLLYAFHPWSIQHEKLKHAGKGISPAESQNRAQEIKKETQICKRLVERD